MPRKKIDALVDLQRLRRKGLAYIAIHEDGSLKSSFAKFMTDERNAGKSLRLWTVKAGDLTACLPQTATRLCGMFRRTSC